MIIERTGYQPRERRREAPRSVDDLPSTPPDASAVQIFSSTARCHGSWPAASSPSGARARSLRDDAHPVEHRVLVRLPRLERDAAVGDVDVDRLHAGTALVGLVSTSS